MSTYADYISLVDFSLIETAVQSLFVGVAGAGFVAAPDESNPNRGKWTPAAGQIGFYTNKNVLVNQEARPRVTSRLPKISVVPRGYVIDDNGIMREKAWTAVMIFGIVTSENYTAHAALRAKVAAIIPQVMPKFTVDNSLFKTTGINALLTKHEVSQFSISNLTTDVMPTDGAYMSQIPVDLAFNVQESAWPNGGAGFLTF